MLTVVRLKRLKLVGEAKHQAESSAYCTL